MNKKIWAMLLVLVMIVGMLPITAFAAETCSYCGGDAIVDQTTPGVTCCNAGLVLFKCVDCESTWPGHSTNGQAHSYIAGECLFVAPGDAGGCNHAKTYTETIEATCGAEGSIKEICDGCDAVLSETVLEKTDDHLFLPEYENGEKCRVCDAALQSVCQHEYEITKEEPGNCVIPGYVWKVCTLCGKQNNYETTVDANVHQGFVNGKCACGLVCLHEEFTTETKMANCKEEGYSKEICKLCKKVLTETTLEKTDEHTFLPNHKEGKECVRCGAVLQSVCEHEYEITKEEPGNCVIPGYVWEVCKLCGKQNNYETTVDANVHQGFVNGKCACGLVCLHEEFTTETKMANCKEEGYSKEICKLCKKVLAETVLEKTDDHTFLPNHKEGKECVRCGAALQDVCEHEYEITKEEPGNCVIPGYVWEVCKLCGKQNNHETTVDANVHQGFVNGKCACGLVCLHEETRTETQMATCKEEGFTKEICKLCAKVMAESVLEKTNDHTFLPNHKEGKECVRCGAALQDVCNHEFEIVKAEPGNCSLTGYAWEVCKLCGKEYNHETDIIPSAHNFVNGRCASCFKPCACDMEYEDVKQATCHEEGYRKVRCVKCDKVLHETILEKTNDHVFKADYENGKKCALCGANLQDVCEHDYAIVREEAATCEDTGYIWKECNLCGKEYNHETPVDPDGHVYKTLKWELPTCEEPGHIWQECTLCGHKDDREDGAAMGHKYENGKCFCGEPDPNCPHTNHVENMDLYRAATCTVDGVHVYECPNCGTQQKETIPMLGHDKVEKKVDATCTTDGLRIVSCARCKQLLEEETLGATGHTYVDGKCACGVVDPVTVCKHPESLQSTHTQAATCTEDGYIIVTCNGCNTMLSKMTLEHKGHTGEITVHAPTCTASGAKIETCTTCNAQLSYEVLSSTGHNYVNGVCGSCGAADPNKYTEDYQDIFMVG